MARVLVLTVAHPPADARILHRQIASLAEFGHRVTYGAPFSAFQTPPPEGLDARDLPRSAGNPLRRVVPLAKAVALVVRERRRHEVIIAHDPELLPALAAARLPSRHRRPVVVWDVHEDVPAQVSMLPIPTGLRRATAQAIRLAERVAERRFRLLLAERSYQDRFQRTHPVVPNSVRVPTGGPWPAESHPRVVYLGALTWPRGAQELIDLARCLPDVHFEVIGNAKPDVDVALRGASEELDNLEYRGFVPNDQALSRLPGALAGLSLLHDVANYAQSEPTKVMEYMAFGVPTVTTPNPASRRLVEETSSGIVIPFGDVSAAAAAIRRLDSDRRERERLAAHAYRTARDHDWNTDGQSFAALIEDWASGAPTVARA